MKIIIFICIFMSVVFSKESFTLNIIEYPPLINKKEGIIVDIIEELFKESNISYKINFTSKLESIKKTKKNSYNIIVPFQQLQENKTKFKWVGPIFVYKKSIFSLNNNKVKIKNIEDLFKYVVLVKKNSTEENYLNNFQVKTQALNNQIQNIYKLKVNRANFWATDNISAYYYSKKTKIKLKKQFTLFKDFRYLAFNIKTNDKIIKLLNKNLRTIYKNERIKQISLDYSHIYDIQNIFEIYE